MSKLTNPDNVKTLPNAITSTLAKIDEDGPQTGLKISITGASLEELTKVKWNRKDWISEETLDPFAAFRGVTLHN